MKIDTPPCLNFCLQYLAPSVYWQRLILSISTVLMWCSVRQSTWGSRVHNEIRSSSILLFNSLMFWCKILRFDEIYRFECCPWPWNNWGAVSWSNIVCQMYVFNNIVYSTINITWIFITSAVVVWSHHKKSCPGYWIFLYDMSVWSWCLIYINSQSFIIQINNWYLACINRQISMFLFGQGIIPSQN